VAAGIRAEARAPAGARQGRPPPLSRFHQLVAAESLSSRGGHGAARLAPALAHASVDLNPHQVEAAAFALGALPTGGAVLADEVGLGKTIEAGLVISQLAAEGHGRTVVLVPASLRIQWRDELRSKFGLAAEVVDGERARSLPGNPFDLPGVVIASHAFAALRADELARVPWDLAVVDEAHRLRNAWRRDHRTGQALRRGLRRAPKLLLTATPLQNDVMELLGLAGLIDDALLGSEESFRLQYGAGELDEERAADLKARLAPVVTRTLRRQVREYVRFTARRSMVEDFAPTPEEQALYDRVSEYLRREDAFAIPRSRRALMVLVYRKILASSSFALASTLERLAASLEGLVAGVAADADGCPELEGFAEEAEEWGPDDDDATAPRRTPAVLRRMEEELAELRACARAARAIRRNAKGDALCRGLDRAFTVARACGWPEKAVVFTEFRATQEHLRALLGSHGLAVTCLSGDSGGPDRRQALVDEFRDRTQVLLMTEAGAEGLNLQFCNLVVNYDLPWNPQRVEQRIGRCHRYGQSRDVLVVNFLNRRNAAEARLYELLGEKLKLFDGVFGASDDVLGALGSGVDFERRVLEIYQACRSAEEVDRAFEALRRDLDGRIEARLAAARSLLFERFDGDVRARLRLAAREAEQAVARQEAEEEALVRSVLDGGGELAVPGDGPDAGLPGGGAPSGASPRAAPESPRARRARLARAAAEAVRARPAEAVHRLAIDPGSLPARLAPLAGREGWWFAWRFTFGGLAPEERIAHLVLWFDGDAWRTLPADDAALLAGLPARDGDGAPGAAAALGAAQEEALARLQAEIQAEVETRSLAAWDEARERWDRAAEDALGARRHAAEEARAAWRRAREAPHEERSPLPLRDRRALLERAEREFRRRLEDLRAAEALRYGEKDRALAELRRRAEARGHRKLIATAWWRCR
jgi:superfamily II DNA or RNA helicase